MRRPTTGLALITALSIAHGAAAAQREPVRNARPATREAQAPTGATSAPAPLTSNVDARQTKEELERILDQYPPSLGRVLRLDPTLRLRARPRLQQWDCRANPESLERGRVRFSRNPPAPIRPT